MLAETIKRPEEYLVYSEQVLIAAGIPESCPKINAYYHELCAQFIAIFYTPSLSPFEQWGQLLAVDAQLQILLELTQATQVNLAKELGMSEEEIIHMIRRDKKSFYRELTGGNTKHPPRWGLIYLSEE